METIKKFMPADRYVFDFKLCAPRDGWAQVDTSQDASYYGTWANPFKLEVITYLEGDIVIKKADNTDEFILIYTQIDVFKRNDPFSQILIEKYLRNAAAFKVHLRKLTSPGVLPLCFR